MNAKSILAALFAGLLCVGSALAQSSPNLKYKDVPTAAQWNNYFIAKQDYLGYTPVNRAGDVMLGRLTTVPSTAATTGFNLPPGAAPTAPGNGDLWTTTAGMFVRINGATVGPLSSPSAAAFAATSPITVSFPSSIVTYACPTCVTSSGGGAITGTAPINVTAAGLVSINTNGIGNTLLRQGVARSVVGVTGNATANVADIQGTADQVFRINSAGTALAFGQINLASTNAVTGITQVANGGTSVATWTVHGIPVGQGTSTPTFVGPCIGGQAITGQGASVDPICNDTHGINYTQTGTGAIARTQWSKDAEFRSIDDFGASPGASASTNTTAFQNAVNAITTGGTLWVPTSGYGTNGPVTISKPMTIKCAPYLDPSTGNINGTAGAGAIFKINSSFVNIVGCYLNRSGVPVAGDVGVQMGQDYVTVSNATITNGSAGLTSATANFTAGDVGKHLFVVNGGVAGSGLVTSIASVTNSTTIVMGNAATCGGGCPSAGAATANWGVWYQEVILDSLSIVNHTIGVDVGAVGHVHLSKLYLFATNPLQIFNHLGQGYGASEISGSTIFGDNSSYGVVYRSGSDWRFVNNKFLGGIYNFYMQWDQSYEGNLILTDSSLENYQTASIFLTASQGYERIVIANNSFAGAANAQAIVVDNSASVAMTNLNIIGNTVQQNTSINKAIDIGKISGAVVIGNTIDQGGTGTCINLASNSVNVTAIPNTNYLNCATNISNSGTGNVIASSVNSGGTGVTSLGNHGVLLGQGTSAIGAVAAASSGTLLRGVTGADPQFTSGPALGINGTTTGFLDLANGGASGASVRLQNLGATTQYNFNFPTSAGTAGQALISAGGGSNPQAYGPLALANLATQNANTVVANATSGTAAPTAFAMTSCSTAASALNWTTNTGFGCNTSITAAGVPVSGITGAGTGVTTALGVNVGSAGSVVVNGGALGTPSSGTLTNATGLPISTGVAGLGTGVATGLSTASLGSGGVALGTQGTWTPTWVGSSVAGTQTYGIQVGTYEIHGRTVTARFTIQITAISGATGNANLGGLPATSQNLTNNNGSCFIHFFTGVTLTASYTSLMLLVGPNSAVGNFYELGSGVAGQAAAVGKFAPTFVLEGTCIYNT